VLAARLRHFRIRVNALGPIQGNVAQGREGGQVNQLVKFEVATCSNRNHCNFLVFGSSDQLSAICHDCSDLGSVSLHSLDYLALSIPHLHKAIVATCVAPTLLVEGCTHQIRLRSFAKSTFLEKFLSHISWVPKIKLFGADCDEPEVVCSLGPSQVENLALAAVNSDEFNLSLQVVDGDAVLLVLVDCCDVSSAGAEADSGNSFRILLKLERVNFLGSLRIPNVDAGGLADLSCYDPGAVLRDVHA